MKSRRPLLEIMRELKSGVLEDIAADYQRIAQPDMRKAARKILLERKASDEDSASPGTETYRLTMVGTGRLSHRNPAASQRWKKRREA